MALWQVTSYRTVIDTELQLQRTITLLRERYGRRWRRHAPADLVWMLRTGVGIDEAAARIQQLADMDDPATIVDAKSCNGGSTVVACAGDRRRPGRKSPDMGKDLLDDRPGWSQLADVHRDRFDEAMWLNRQHWIDVGRPISAETLRQQLHVSADASRELTRAMRATDRAAILAAGIPQYDRVSPVEVMA